MATRINENPASCSIPCNICGTGMVEEISLKDRKGDYLRTVICLSCGLIWSDPRPPEGEIRDYYSCDYRQEYKGVYQPELKHIYRDARNALQRYDFLSEILDKNSVILDIGSGAGVFVYALRKMGFNAAGLEPNEGYAKYAVDELRVPVQVGFIQDIEDSTKYDLITLHHVLEHLYDPLGILRKAAALLKDDGFLAIEVPNAENLTQDPKNRYHSAHLYTFNPETLEHIGQKAGFKVHKRQIAPYRGNIDVIFKKNVNSGQQDNLAPDNYQKITNILNRHTNFRHFTTFTPYKKIMGKALTALEERLAVRKFETGKKIVDDVMAKGNFLARES